MAHPNLLDYARVAGRPTPEPSTPVDRRVAKTKNALRVAFIELLGEKDFDKITVQELTERANVTRRTFYLHYETIDAFLGEIALEDFATLFDEMRKAYFDEGEFCYLQFFTDLTMFLDATTRYHRIFTDDVSRTVVTKALENYMDIIVERDGIEVDPLTRAHLVYAISGAAALYTDWYVTGRTLPLERIAEIAQRLAGATTSSLRIELSAQYVR